MDENTKGKLIMLGLAQTTHPQPAGPSIWDTLRCVSSFQKDPLQFLSDMQTQYGDIVKLPLAGNAVLICHPDAVRYVLQENHRNYQKGQDYKRMSVVVGQGLLTANGELWRRHRRLLQPGFHKQKIAGFADIMVARTKQRLAKWREQGTELTVDLHAEMMALTLEIVGECLFSTDLSSETEEVGVSLGHVLHMTNHYINELVPLPLWIPTPFARRFRKELAVLDRSVFQIIQNRLHAEPAEPSDLLGMMISAHAQGDENSDDKGFSLQELRDEVMTLFLAGHETTANALSFTFLLLSQNPQVAEQLHAETLRTLGNRTPTAADVPQLGYAKQVAEESLRLYPPAWAFGREAIAEDCIGSFVIAPGTQIVMSPFLTQRDPRFFPDPLAFRPARFSAQEVAKRPHGTYFPFAAGPRQCIGIGFAMMELQLILSTLLRDVEITALAPQSVTLDAQITLRPKDGMPARIRFRDAAA